MLNRINLARQVFERRRLVVERQLDRRGRAVALFNDDDFGDVVGDEVGFGCFMSCLRLFAAG